MQCPLLPAIPAAGSRGIFSYLYLSSSFSSLHCKDSGLSRSLLQSPSHTTRKGEDIVQKLLRQKNTLVKPRTRGTQKQAQDQGSLQWDCIASFSFSTAIFCCWREAPRLEKKSSTDQNALSAKSFCQLTAKRHQHFLFLSSYPLPSASEEWVFQCSCFGFNIPNLWMHDEAFSKLTGGRHFLQK